MPDVINVYGATVAGFVASLIVLGFGLLLFVVAFVIALVGCSHVENGYCGDDNSVSSDDPYLHSVADLHLRGVRKWLD